MFDLLNIASINAKSATLAVSLPIAPEGIWQILFFVLVGLLGLGLIISVALLFSRSSRRNRNRKIIVQQPAAPQPAAQPPVQPIILQQPEPQPVQPIIVQQPEQPAIQPIIVQQPEACPDLGAQYVAAPI